MVLFPTPGFVTGLPFDLPLSITSPSAGLTDSHPAAISTDNLNGTTFTDDMFKYAEGLASVTTAFNLPVDSSKLTLNELKHQQQLAQIDGHIAPEQSEQVMSQDSVREFNSSGEISNESFSNRLHDNAKASREFLSAAHVIPPAPPLPAPHLTSSGMILPSSNSSQPLSTHRLIPSHLLVRQGMLPPMQYSEFCLAGTTPPQLRAAFPGMLPSAAASPFSLGLVHPDTSTAEPELTTHEQEGSDVAVSNNASTPLLADDHSSSGVTENTDS